MSFSRLSIVLLRRNRHRRGSWATELRTDVSAVDDLVRDGPVATYLVGGLGMAMHEDEFYRNHGDIDLAIYLTDLGAFCSHLRAKNYELRRARFSLVITPWHRIEVSTPIRERDACEAPDDLALRIMHGASRTFSVRRRRTEYLDVHLMGRRRADIVMHGYGAVVPREHFHPATPVSANSRLFLPQLPYKRYLPVTWKRQRQDFAMAGLEVGTPRAPQHR